jgi:hypothetical protein
LLRALLAARMPDLELVEVYDRLAGRFPLVSVASSRNGESPSRITEP